MKGGYININFNGLNLSLTTEQIIEGIYKKMINAINTNKPIIIYNTKQGEYLCTPTNANCLVTNNGLIKCYMSLYEININENDIITVNDLSS